MHFGSNPKEELLGLFCISDSGQGLRSIKQHVGVFISTLRYFGATAELQHVEEAADPVRQHISVWLCTHGSAAIVSVSSNFSHETLFDSNNEPLVFLDDSFKKTAEHGWRPQFKQC